MKYNEIRDRIRSGDLLAFARNSWTSSVIRIFTRSTYSHVGVAWVTGGRVFILESVGHGGTRIFPLSLSGDFYLLPLRAPWTPSVEEFALENVGIRYSVLDAILAYFGRLPRGSMRECAAYALEIYRRACVDLGDRATPDAVVLEAQKRRAVETIFVTNPGAL